LLCRSFSFPAWLWLLARSRLKKLLLKLPPKKWLLLLKPPPTLPLRLLTRWLLLLTPLLLRLLTLPLLRPLTPLLLRLKKPRSKLRPLLAIKEGRHPQGWRPFFLPVVAACSTS
jgi:hypothetical protein